MKKITLQITDIKEYTNCIKEASPGNLKHSELLHQISQSLGFKNYQTLKGLADKNRGYLEVSSKYFDSSIVKKRFNEIEVLKKEMIQKFNNVNSNKNQNEDYFYKRGLELLDLVTESLMVFSFIDYNKIDINKIIKDYMSFNGIVYFYCMALKLNTQDITEKIKKYFSYNDVLNEDILTIEAELNKTIYYVCNFNEFLINTKPFEIFTNLQQQLAYAQQQWTFLKLENSTISNMDTNKKTSTLVSKDKTKFLYEQIASSQSVLIVDKKSDIVNEARRRLFKKITLVNNHLYIKIENMKQLKELLLLLNKETQQLDENIVFPCLFNYRNGEIKILKYDKNICSKEHMRLYEIYKLFRLELFKEENNLSYDASLNDFKLISKDESINYSDYVEKTLKNTSLRNILISIDVELFHGCRKIEEYNRLKKMALYLINNYNFKNIEENIKEGFINGCSEVKDNEFLKFLLSNKHFQKQKFLNCALGISYYNNNEQIINYLTKERNVQFTKNVYSISLKWAIGGNELNRVKEISKNINLKEDYNGDFWYSSYEIIDFLVSQGLDINKNSKNTISSAIYCNELDKIKFLKNKGLNLVFDSTTKKELLQLAIKERQLNFYNWLKDHIKTKKVDN